MRQVRQIRYRKIADDLRSRITAGELTAGAVLASEADLAGSYEVSRVTVRKALDLLRGEGLVDSRQGFGWFVAADTVRQSLRELDTIEAQLAADGRVPKRQVHSFSFVRAPDRVRQVLGSDEVLEVVRVNLADGRPFGLVTVWCPDRFGAELSRADVEARSFYELLPVELGGATQTIGAALADERDHQLLDVPEKSPLLVCERISRDRDGEAVLLAEHRFPAHLTEFVVELTSPNASLSPQGLRLVDPA